MSARRALAILVAVCLIPVAAADAQQWRHPDEAKILEGALQDWNKRVPARRDDLLKTLTDQLEKRAKEPWFGYEDPDWVKDVLAVVTDAMPSTIQPSLKIDDETVRRYVGIVDPRIDAYGRRVLKKDFERDLRTKFYVLAAVAEKLAKNDKKDRIEFRYFRRAMFLLQTGVWPWC